MLLTPCSALSGSRGWGGGVLPPLSTDALRRPAQLKLRRLPKIELDLARFRGAHDPTRHPALAQRRIAALTPAPHRCTRRSAASAPTLHLLCTLHGCLCTYSAPTLHPPLLPLHLLCTYSAPTLHPPWHRALHGVPG